MSIPSLLNGHPLSDEQQSTQSVEEKKGSTCASSPSDEVRALIGQETVSAEEFEKILLRFEATVKPSKKGSLSALNKLKLSTLRKLSALVFNEEGKDAALGVIADLMEGKPVAQEGHPEAVQGLLEVYFDAEQHTKNALLDGFRHITQAYQRKLFHDAAVDIEFKYPEAKAEEESITHAGSAGILKTINVRKLNGAWVYSLKGENKATSIEALRDGDKIVALLNRHSLSYGETNPLIPEPPLSFEQKDDLKRAIRHVVLTDRESTKSYIAGQFRYLWSNDHYQNGPTLRGYAPWESDWEKDNLNYIQLIDTLAQMDTDGRYIDAIAKIINVPGRFNKDRQALFSNMLDGIFFDIQKRKYAEIAENDIAFFVKLEAYFKQKVRENAVFNIYDGFFDIVKQPATSYGDEVARSLASKSAKDLFDDVLIQKKFIATLLAERDRVHAQKAVKQADLKKLKKAIAHLKEQLGFARHIKSNEKDSGVFLAGHQVKYTYDEAGTLLISAEKQDTRKWKERLFWIALIVGVIVGLGEGVVAAAPLAMLFFPLVFVGGALCNYFLMRGDTYDVLLGAFTKSVVKDADGNERLVRKIWIDRDGNEVSFLTKCAMVFCGLTALGAGVVYGSLSASCLLELLGFSVSSLIAAILGGGASVAPAAITLFFLLFPAICTAIALTSILFIVIAKFIKDGGLWKLYAGFNKMLGNDAIGKSFGLFTFERFIYVITSILGEAPRALLAIVLSVIVLFVGFILFKECVMLLLVAFGLSVAAATIAGFVFASMNTSASILFAFKKNMQIIDMVWKGSSISPVAKLLFYPLAALFDLLTDKAYVAAMHTAVDAYAYGSLIEKPSEPFSWWGTLFELSLGLPTKIVRFVLTFTLKLVLKSALSVFWLVAMAMGKTYQFNAGINAVIDKLTSVLVLPVLIIGYVIGGVFALVAWFMSDGKSNFWPLIKAFIDKALNVFQPAVEHAGVPEYANPIQNGVQSALAVKWAVITLGALANSTGQAGLWGKNIPLVPSFMKSTFGIATMPSELVLSIIIFPSVWVYSFGPNKIAYEAALAGQIIPALNDGYFSVRVERRGGELQYCTVIDDGRELGWKSVASLGETESTLIADGHPEVGTAETSAAMQHALFNVGLGQIKVDSDNGNRDSVGVGFFRNINPTPAAEIPTHFPKRMVA